MRCRKLKRGVVFVRVSSSQVDPTSVALRRRAISESVSGTGAAETAQPARSRCPSGGSGIQETHVPRVRRFLNNVRLGDVAVKGASRCYGGCVHTAEYVRIRTEDTLPSISSTTDVFGAGSLELLSRSATCIDRCFRKDNGVTPPFLRAVVSMA